MNDKMTPRELAKRIARGEKWKLAEPDQELAGLPEGVREAVVAIDTGNGVFVGRDDGIGGEKWHTVRAELLRLNAELAALKRRIAEAKVVEVGPIGEEVWLDGDEYGNTNVALLVLDGGER